MKIGELLDSSISKCNYIEHVIQRPEQGVSSPDDDAVNCLAFRGGHINFHDSGDDQRIHVSAVFSVM